MRAAFSVPRLLEVSRMTERIELVKVPFEDEGQSEQGEGTPIDIYDPSLQMEEVEIDPEADAFATSVTLKVKMDMRGLLASSVAVLQYGYGEL
jgi:hypothetical protein